MFPVDVAGEGTDLVAGLETAAPGGIFGVGGAAGTQGSSSSPRGFPGCLLLPPGIPWGSKLSLVCGIQAWSFLLHQNWLE